MFVEAPLSFGQLYSWREIEAYPADGKQEANLPATWDLRGFSPEQVQLALRQLIRRHEPLRTAYHLDNGVPVQRVHADPPAPVELVDRLITDAGEPDRHTAELIGVALAMTGQLCWRGVQVSSHGAPMYLSLSFSHLILDVWSVLALQSQFSDLLASAGAEPAGAEPAPRELACQQRQDSGQSRRAGAERYWRQVLTTQPAHQLPALADGVRKDRIQATLHSHRLGVLAAQVARAQGVTPPAVLLGLIAAALSEHIGAERITMSLMSSNRFAAEHRHLVTTMNQLIPVLVQVEPGASLAEHITKAHWSGAKAYRHSSYDLDQVLAIAAESGVDAGFNGLFRCWFNYLQLDAVPLDPARRTPAELVWQPLARQFGQPVDVRVTVREGRTSIALRADPEVMPADALAGVLRVVSQGVALAAASPASSLADLWNSRGADLPAALFPPAAPAQTRISAGAGWLKKAVGLAVRP